MLFRGAGADRIPRGYAQELGVWVVGTVLPSCQYGCGGRPGKSIDCRAQLGHVIRRSQRSGPSLDHGPSFPNDGRPVVATGSAGAGGSGGNRGAWPCSHKRGSNIIIVIIIITITIIIIIIVTIIISSSSSSNQQCACSIKPVSRARRMQTIISRQWRHVAAIVLN